MIHERGFFRTRPLYRSELSNTMPNYMSGEKCTPEKKKTDKGHKAYGHKKHSSATQNKRKLRRSAQTPNTETSRVTLRKVEKRIIYKRS